MFKTLSYCAEYSSIEIVLMKRKGGYSFGFMQIYRDDKHETITDNEEYVFEDVKKMLKEYLQDNKKKIFKELGLEKDELTTQGAIELHQIINKVKSKLCKSKEK